MQTENNWTICFVMWEVGGLSLSSYFSSHIIKCEVGTVKPLLQTKQFSIQDNAMTGGLDIHTNNLVKYQI